MAKKAAKLVTDETLSELDAINIAEQGLQMGEIVEVAEDEVELVKAATETKEQLFKRVAERRVKNALHQIKLLGNTANKHVYGYTPEQAQKIILVLSTAVTQLKFQYEKTKSAEKDEFSL